MNSFWEYAKVNDQVGLFRKIEAVSNVSPVANYVTNYNYPIYSNIFIFYCKFTIQWIQVQDFQAPDKEETNGKSMV